MPHAPRIRASRDEAYEIESLVGQLAGVGPRPPASQAEAQAAAFVNGRLRRAGMGVSTYELRSLRRPGGAYALLAVVGLLAAGLAPLLQLPSLLMALVLLGALLYDAVGAPLPSLGRLAVSQNIVGTRAIAGAGGLAPRQPRWRVLLLAPLDTPTSRRGPGRLATPRRGPALLRIAGPLLLGLAATGLWLQPGRALWWAPLIAGALLLLALLVADLLPPQPEVADGSLAALAALVAAATRLGTLETVELWALAVGAAGSDPRGVESLLARFPFDRERTLVIALEQLTGGQLVYATREGGLAPRPADPLLLRLSAAADADDPQIDAEPRPLEAEGVLAGPLRRRGFRALTLVSRPAPGAATPADTPPDQALVERTTRLVLGVVRGLDAETGDGRRKPGDR